jgi:hypothetical protein
LAKEFIVRKRRHPESLRSTFKSKKFEMNRALNLYNPLKGSDSPSTTPDLSFYLFRLP